MNRRETALALAAEGFWIFPLRPGTKLPAISGWPEKATRDPEQIRAWWAERDYNIAIFTGCFRENEALLVVDVDKKHGADGDAALDLLELAGHELGPTRTTTTPTGGRHLFHSVPAAVRQGAGVLGAGVDIRSRQGYVVGPASAIGEAIYAVSDDSPVRPAPAWLVARCGERVRQSSERDAAPVAGIDRRHAYERALCYLRDDAPLAVEGAGGDETTYKVACRVRDFGVDFLTAWPLIGNEWNHRCSPPWEPDDLHDKVVNAYKYGENQPGSAAPEAGFTAVVEKGFSEPFDDIEPDMSRPALVKNWLDTGGSSLWYGAPGSNKTFLMLHLSLCVAMGWEWLGSRTRQGPVLYCALEGGIGIRRRIKAMKLHHGVAGQHVPVYVSVQPLNLGLTTRQTADKIIAECALIEKRERQPVALVIVDTVHRALQGADENDSGAIGAFIANLDLIRHETGAHGAAVHHTGKVAASGPRGSSAFHGDIDTMILVDAGAVRIPDGSLGKQKDGAAGGAVGYRRLDVSLGPDADGDEVRSCVIDRVALPAPANTAKGFDAVLKLSLGDKAALKLLGDLTLNGPVALDTWKTAMCPATGTAKEKGATAQAYRRARARLLAAERIDTDDIVVWIKGGSA